MMTKAQRIVFFIFILFYRFDDAKIKPKEEKTIRENPKKTEDFP